MFLDIKYGRTIRGFELLTFRDDKRVDCSIQKSSLATDNAVWIGCDEPDPQYMVPGAGWQKITLPPDTVSNTRMHLTQDQVRELIPILTYFAETGELPRFSTDL